MNGKRAGRSVSGKDERQTRFTSLLVSSFSSVTNTRRRREGFARYTVPGWVVVKGTVGTV